MRALTALTEILFVSLLALGTAATYLEIALVPFGFMIAFCIGRFQVRQRQVGRRKAVGALLLSIATGTAVLVGAALYKPTKSTEKLLDRPTTLPKTELTLAEIDELAGWNRDDGFPYRFSMRFAEIDQDMIVRFPARDLTLREFVAVIENQTPLRFDFAICGSGMSLLFGPSGIMGMNLRDPTLSGPIPRAKAFER